MTLICTADRYKWVSETLLHEMAQQCASLAEPKKPINRYEMEKVPRNYGVGQVNNNNNNNNNNDNTDNGDNDDYQCLSMEKHYIEQCFIRPTFDSNQWPVKRTALKKWKSRNSFFKNSSSFLLKPTIAGEQKHRAFSYARENSLSPLSKLKANRSLESILNREEKLTFPECRLPRKKLDGLESRKQRVATFGGVRFCTGSFDDDSGGILDNQLNSEKSLMSCLSGSRDFLTDEDREGPAFHYEELRLYRAKFMASAAEKLLTADRNMREAQRSGSGPSLLPRTAKTRSLLNLFFPRKFSSAEISNPVLISSTKSSEYLQSLPEVQAVNISFEDVSISFLSYSG